MNRITTIEQWLKSDPRIGALNNGTYYIMVDGYPKEVRPPFDYKWVNGKIYPK